MCTVDAISALRGEGLSTIIAVHQWISPSGSEWPCEGIFADNSRLSWAVYVLRCRRNEKQEMITGFTTPRRLGPWRAKNYEKNNEFTSYLVSALKTQLGHVTASPPSLMHQAPTSA
ncbi:hypothetical protein HN011_009311 [Eciton burchellii]|jgi:hypothetical protein|nr:hypothetical protein HN011_009311 [Eciton burchellii]